MERRVKTRQNQSASFLGTISCSGKSVTDKVLTVNKPSSDTLNFWCSGYDFIFVSCLLRVGSSLLSTRKMRLVGAELLTRRAELH